MEKKQFTAEVGKVLHLMIHSLYTNKDIAIRELVSNASDACDKLRYLSQTDQNLLKDDHEFKITIEIQKDKRNLIIEDNGIGMNYNDLIDNLGTIAKSGTQNFLEQLSGDTQKDSKLIGQFGVGFYSAFMIADRVNVESKKAGETKSYTWFSYGDGEYNISETSTDIKRGTKITLHIKEGMDDYLDHFRIKNIVKTYSDHISVPIYFRDETGTEIQTNSGSALWTRNKLEISPEQYKDFYISVSYSADDPWLIIHNKNEGLVEYTNLLFIPSKKTFDLFHPDRRRRVKLYIRKVFITDENAELVPHYLRFLRGVIDSEDLPLNVSRENLQYNATIDKIRNSVTKKIISELNKQIDSERDSYISFWNNFGAVLKEGLCEVTTDAEKLLEISLFYSAKQDKLISLKDYIESLPSDVKTIYFLSGQSNEKLKHSPQIEGFLEKNIDVLLFTDPVDDFWVNVVNNYKGYDIKSVTRSEIEPKNDIDKEKTTDQIENANIINLFKNILGDNVKDVVFSKKLTSSPSCLSVREGDMDIRMERFLIEQKQLHKSSAKILEINSNHQIIKILSSEIEKSGFDNINDSAKDIVWLLFDQACIIEGEPVIDPNSFSKRISNIITNSYEIV